MNPNDTDGHQVGNGLGVEQPNTFAPNTGDAFNAPQAPIISSSPDPEDKKENSITRAFGGRSRASKIAAQAPVQPSNLRQNAPDFFQQSMQQQDIVLNAAAEKKQKSKKGLLIGGIIGGVVLLGAIIAIAYIAILPNGGVKSDAKIAEYKEFLENGISTVEKYDSLLQAAKDNSIGLQVGITNEQYESDEKSLEENLNNIIKFRDSLEDNLGITVNDKDAQEKIKSLETELVSSIDERIPIYEKYKSTLLSLNEVYKTRGSDDAIGALSKVDNNDYLDMTVAVIDNYYSERVALNQRWLNNNCNNIPDAQVCSSTLESIARLDESYNKDENLSKFLASYTNGLEKDPANIMREILAILEEEEANEE
jgi:hypothetical protein